MKCFLSFIVLVALTTTAAAQCLSIGADPTPRDWFVDATATNPSATGTKSDPLPSLNIAFTVADDNDRVFVAPGTYSASLTGEVFPMQWGSSATISQLNIEIIGTGGPTVTIIDGEMTAASGLGMVRFRALAAGGKLRGFTLRNYAGTNGIIRLGSTSAGFEASDVEISECIIENSTGFGIATFGASNGLKIHDCVVRNTTDSGIWLSDASTNSNPCTGGSGGGQIYNNTVTNCGNGIRLQGGFWVLRNNLVVFNNNTTAPAPNFGIYHECCLVQGTNFGYDLDYNNVFGNNGGDFGVVTDPFCAPGSTQPVATPCAAPTPGANTMSVDPMLMAGDYHLMTGSPVTDAGLSTVPNFESADIDADSRLTGAGIDIGADEITDVRHNVPGGVSLSFGVATLEVTAPAGDVIIRALSLGRSNTVTGFGNLLLDFNTILFLDAFPPLVPGVLSIVPPGGLAILPLPLFTLPPSAIGTPIYSQAVLVGTAGTRLTNVVNSVICP